MKKINAYKTIQLFFADFAKFEKQSNENYEFAIVAENMFSLSTHHVLQHMWM